MRESRGGEGSNRSPDLLENSDFLNFHITVTKNPQMPLSKGCVVTLDFF